MPFKSEKQRRFLWANKPAVARKFANDAKPNNPNHWLKKKV